MDVFSSLYSKSFLGNFVSCVSAAFTAIWGGWVGSGFLFVSSSNDVKQETLVENCH